MASSPRQRWGNVLSCGEEDASQGWLSSGCGPTRAAARRRTVISGDGTHPEPRSGTRASTTAPPSAPPNCAELRSGVEVRRRHHAVHLRLPGRPQGRGVRRLLQGGQIEGPLPALPVPRVPVLRAGDEGLGLRVGARRRQQHRRLQRLLRGGRRRRLRVLQVPRVLELPERRAAGAAEAGAEGEEGAPAQGRRAGAAVDPRPAVLVDLPGRPEDGVVRQVLHGGEREGALPALPVQGVPLLHVRQARQARQGRHHLRRAGEQARRQDGHRPLPSRPYALRLLLREGVVQSVVQQGELALPLQEVRVQGVRLLRRPEVRGAEV